MSVSKTTPHSLPEYSVLMAIYAKAKPEELKQAFDSLNGQTHPLSQLVLVLDGLVPESVEDMVSYAGNLFGTRLTIIRLPENSGLGIALAKGLDACVH